MSDKTSEQDSLVKELRLHGMLSESQLKYVSELVLSRERTLLDEIAEPLEEVNKLYSPSGDPFQFVGKVDKALERINKRR